MASKAINTVKKYSYAWSRWKAWASEKIGVDVLPAQPLMIALYINDLLESSKSASVLESAFYAFRWAHKLAGFESPTFHPVVRAALEAGKRAVGKPVSPKEPLTLDLIQSLAEFYNRPEAKLDQIRFLFTVLIGYAGFMRMDEILSVRCIDISFGEAFMSIFIPKRKNDQHREGHTVDVAFSGKISCPVLITKRLLSLLPNSEDSCAPIVRRIIANRKGNKFHPSLGISYTTAKGDFKKYVKPFVQDISQFGTHSIKSGAAGNSACRSLDGGLIDKHAGWRNANSKNRYIKYSKEELLSVSKRLGI